MSYSGIHPFASSTGFARTVNNQPLSFRPGPSQWSKAVAALAVGGLITAAAWGYTADRILEDQRTEFTRVVSDTTKVLREHLHLYMQNLHGMAALFAASDRVTADEFKRYVMVLEARRQLPAVQAVAFQPLSVASAPDGYFVPLESAPDGTSRLRERVGDLIPAGLQDREIRASRPFPSEGQEGLALFAPARSNDNGEGVITLVVGIDRMMRQLFRPSRFHAVVLAIHDTGPVSSPAESEHRYRLFRSADIESVEPISRNGGHTDHLHVAGRRWRLDYLPGPDLGGGSERWLPRLVLAAGFSVTALLFAQMLTSMSRRGAAQMAEHLAAELRESEERLHKMIRSLDDVIWSLVLDPVPHFSFISPSAEKTFGLSLARFHANPDAWLDHVHPDDRAEVERMRTQARQQSETHMEYRIRHPNGDERWLYHRSFLVQEEGKPPRLDEIISDFTERKTDETRIRQLAFFDPLTHLPNRALLEDRLSQAVYHAGRHRNRLAVLFLDLDRFKEVNDRLGHAAGDRLLQEVARRIGASIRKEDTATRLSGDEFVVVLPDVEGIPDAEKVAAKIIEEVARPYEIAGERAEVTASIGIAVYPTDGTTVDGLMRRADEAMYRAKAGGRNAYVLFSEKGA